MNALYPHCLPVDYRYVDETRAICRYLFPKGSETTKFAPNLKGLWQINRIIKYDRYGNEDVYEYEIAFRHDADMLMYRLALDMKVDLK